MEGTDWIAQIIVICLSIISWAVESKALVQLNKALKIQRRNLKELDVRRLHQAYKFLDDKYNRLCIDTLGKSKVKIDLLEVVIILVILINIVLMRLADNKVGIALLVIGIVILLVIYLKSAKSIDSLSGKQKIELDILRVRIKYNKYIEDLSDNDKRILEKDFENILKVFRNEKNKEAEFKNTVKRLEDLEVRLNRFLKIETIN